MSLSRPQLHALGFGLGTTGIVAVVVLSFVWLVHKDEELYNAACADAIVVLGHDGETYQCPHRRHRPSPLEERDGRLMMRCVCAPAAR